MHSITLKLNSTIRAIGKATADKITVKLVGKNSRFRCSVNNLFEQYSRAAKHVCKIFNIFMLLDKVLPNLE